MRPASPSTARAMNDRRALHLLQEQGPLTAAQLKEHTGLSRPSVADLVERLCAAGLIEVVGESGAQRRGPNAKVYGIVAGRAHLAALDVRTESVRVVVADLLGRPLAEAAQPTSSAAEAVELVARTAAEAGAAVLHTVCAGAPGLIDPASGELRNTVKLPNWHRELAGALQRRELASRVIVENETNLAAVAERAEGASRQADSFVLLWLGDGVGAALVLDGRLRRGASGGAGELGFLPVPGTAGLPSADHCEGGFHSLVGGAAVAALAREHGFGGRAEAAVRTAVAAGPEGKAFLDALAERLALGAAAVTAVLDPGRVVLGGEIGLAGGPALAELVADRLRGLTPVPTAVLATELGDGAVLRGALLTARAAAQDAVFAS
ncbi:ROK family transcriptional regulator [Streptomyces sp. NPDC089919]|uniref:ROK family transcriptional regulator n=1 Tax=Streptomyces sp. NPDC089919 TaxID=3155188 RepID=UPI00341339B4